MKTKRIAVVVGFISSVICYANATKFFHHYHLAVKKGASEGALETLLLLAILATVAGTAIAAVTIFLLKKKEKS